MRLKIRSILAATGVAVMSGTSALADVPMLVGAPSEGRIQVFKVWPGSAEDQQLTHSASDKNLMAWSGDRNRVVYSWARTGRGAVHVMRSDGTNDRRLLDFPAVQLAWSPDDRYILVVARSSIYRLRVRTGRYRKLLDGRRDRSFSGAVWSPDGERIVFVRSTTSPADTDLMQMTRGGKRLKQLHGADALPVQAPDFSPSGQRLTFAAYSGDGSEVFTLGSRGTGLRKLTDSAWNEEAPVWGPKDKIAFLKRSDRADATSRLCIMRPDGKKLIVIDGSASLPVWSPDRRIAYNAVRDGDEKGIFIARPDGRRKHLTDRGLVFDW